MKRTADDYKAKFEQAQADSKKQLEAMQFDHALEGALSGAKARNTKAVRALLETDKLKLNKDGTLTGLSEQLDKIRAAGTAVHRRGMWQSVPMRRSGSRLLSFSANGSACSTGRTMSRQASL